MRAQSSGIRLVTELPDHVPVVCDTMRVSQVIDNLVSNAIKYTDAGGTVTVSARADDECAELSVSDTGQGMTREETARLFADYYRADRVRNSAIQGTGLGLSISRQFVEAHGGTIAVDSEPGTGTTFTVRLPLDGATGD